jgi:hypothetical protein
MNLFVCTGAIGTGKSTAALISLAYLLYRVNSLRRPQLSLGSAPTKPLTIHLMTVTMAKAQSTLISQMKELLLACKDYMRVDREADFAEFQKPDYEYITLG